MSDGLSKLERWKEAAPVLADALFSRKCSVFVDAMFPRRCPVCGSIVVPKGELICPSCLNQLSFVKSPVCKKCGKEVMNDAMEYCYDCTRHKRSFEYGRALLNYDETAKNSMAAIKYKNKREYLDFYADQALKRLGPQLRAMDADALVPVPVHPARRRQRGFNQAEVLAEKMAAGLGIPVCPQMLKRARKTDPQKGLDPAGRLKNLEKAFLAGEIPAGVERVILTDDIYTTGSTIEACSRVLLGAGIKKVYFFSVCIGQGQ